ncbi:MAG: tetratricopeptide repeat protein, partial [Candidatus Polarisedimenticolaceae bacterium]|nr:tetratricopeptide repeat protein [Candidatus Polarisedimenticolaceae bacterium]
MNAQTLNPESEQLWQELRQHLDWSDNFSLVFYFSDNIAATNQLCQRVENYYLGRSKKLNIIAYDSNDEWLEAVPTSLQQNSDRPNWLLLNQDGSEAAQQHYRQLLLRLNERRDQWRRDLKQTLFIVLPYHYLATCRESAPDLWSVRAISEVIEQTITPNPQKKEHTQHAKEQATTTGFPLDKHQQSVVDEWQRLRQQKSDTQGALRATGRAFHLLIKAGRFKSAEQAADDMLMMSRKMGDSPNALRDLSVSLDNVGQVSQQQGRWGDAQVAYEESLELSRRLVGVLGESPESLRDLSVS